MTLSNKYGFYRFTLNDSVVDTYGTAWETYLVWTNRNTDDYINNIPGSSRLNDSISNTNDYDDATLTKAKVNYANGTNEIIETTNTITDGIAAIAFSITVLNDILNIELISEDEDTVYQTIDGNQFVIGNIYNIVQHCYVE